MAKFEQPFDDHKALFDALITETNLDRYATIKVLVNNKQKEIGKVVKANDLIKYETGADVYIIINEKVLDKLSDEQKTIVAEELLAGIYFDSEKDKLVIKTADVKTFSGLLKKFGAEKYLELHELITLIYSQDKEAEAEIEG
jgi:hypothetical protein